MWGVYSISDSRTAQVEHCTNCHPANPKNNQVSHLGDIVMFSATPCSFTVLHGDKNYVTTMMGLGTKLTVTASKKEA